MIICNIEIQQGCVDYNNRKKEAHWARLCVPEGCVYEVIIPKGNITMMKYDSNWNVYERLNLEYGNSGDYWEATEGTYYFYSTNDNEANISVTELSDVSTIKENAVEITEENVKMVRLSMKMVQSFISIVQQCWMERQIIRHRLEFYIKLRFLQERYM